MSAYMLWLNANREKIKSDHPGISITDLSKKAGELWKAMSKEKKEASGVAGAVWVGMGRGGERWCGVGGDGVGPRWFRGWRRRREVPAHPPLLLQEWDRKAEDARRDYEKAMKEYSVGGKSESSKA